MKTLLTLAVASTLVACSSVVPRGTAEPDTPSRAQPAAGTAIDGRAVLIDLPLEPNVMLHLTADASGNWQKISTLGTAELQEGTEASPAALETAFMIATLRAKRTLAEFLSNEVRSTRTLKTISRSVSRSRLDRNRNPSGDLDANADLETEAVQGIAGSEHRPRDERSNRLASLLVERISDSTAAILRGTHVTRRSQREGSVVVELSATRSSIEHAREIARRINGMM